MIVNGWTLYAHPLFKAQVETLEQKVKALKAKDPSGYLKQNNTKRLAAINKLAYEIIPQDLTLPEYRQAKPSRI